MTKPWTKGLFLPAENPASSGNIVAWWEHRRIAFNALVGAIGIFSFIIYVWLSVNYGHQFGEGDNFNPGLSVIAFGIFANIFYTSGWIVESMLLVIRKHGSQTIGPRLFKLGLIFSLILASLPGLLTTVEVALMALHRA